MYPSLEELQNNEIPRAEELVAEGAIRVEEQRARIALFKGSPESRKLLRTLEDTQCLHMRHLETLRREAAEYLEKPKRPSHPAIPAATWPTPD